ncbi:MAG: hypothetical protein HWD86_03180 [Kangiellaceae bacterium]|nr:hypothetical protein [Kangiellaceae bacterium]
MPAPTFSLSTGDDAGSGNAREAHEAAIQAVVDAFYEEIGGIVTGLLPVGQFDASTGRFPARAELGGFYITDRPGTVDGQTFAIGDWLIPLKDDAHEMIYAGNWMRGDYSRVTPRIYDSPAHLAASREPGRGPKSPWQTWSGQTYRETRAGAPDAHLQGVDRGFTILHDVWDATDFGAVPDGTLDGSAGTDNTWALQRLTDAIRNEKRKKFTFPRGVLITEAPLDADNDVNEMIVIDGRGSRLLFRGTTPTENQRFLSLRQTGRNGASLDIQGLQLDLDRNPVRTGGSDMLSIGGFEDVRVRDVVIPSADNMAITIDRGILTVPRSVQVTGCRLGGKPPVDGDRHQYGSIGDTGIWVMSSGYGTLVSGNVIYGCGDDAVAIAETRVEDVSVPALVTNNIAVGVGATAYKSGATHTIFADNYARNTRNDMYRLIDLSRQGGTVFPRGGKIFGGLGLDIGQATKTSLGVRRVLRQRHACGVHLQDCAGAVTILGLDLRNTKREAVKISANNRDFEGLEVRGCSFNDIGETGEVIFRRKGKGQMAVSKIRFVGNTISRSRSALVAWDCGLDARREGQLEWQGNSIVDSAMHENATMFTFAGSGTPYLRAVRISGDHWDRTRPARRIVSIGRAPRDEFELSLHLDGRRIAPLTRGAHLRSGNPHAELVGGNGAWDGEARSSIRQTIPGWRDIDGDNTLLRLDPARAWEVEITGTRNLAAEYDELYYRARWDPLQRRVGQVVSRSGGPSGDCAAELVEVFPDDPSKAVFGGPAILQLQGSTSGWSYDPLISCDVSWREIRGSGLSAGIL